MSSLHLLTFGMTQFCTMRLPHLSWRTSSNTLMTHGSKTPFLRDLHHRAIQTLNFFCDLPSPPSGEPLTHAYMHDSNPAEEDWKSLRPYFGWQSEQVIKNTYQVTSRFG